VNRIVVEGNQRVDAATVESFSNITPGTTVTPAQLNQAFQNILASGLFETAELIPQGGTLVIRVREFPTINVIAFEGNRRLNDEDLQNLIRSRSRRVFSPSVAEADEASIVDAYETQGLLAATVDTRIIRRSENRVDLVFEISEGRVVENQRIGFVGNRAFKDRRLRRVLETKQAGILRTFFRNDTFVADRIEFDRTVLRDFYLSRGYVDFQVLDVTTELARERNATFITFQVREGQQFEIGEVTASSSLDGVDSDEFLEVARLRENIVYSPTLIENAITRMEGLATQQGLDFIRIDPRVSRNDRDLTLDVEFVITRGPRIFVERIDIEGNQTTLDRVVRRQFRIVEGDPFNPREIRNAAARIRALNFFSTVDLTTREGSGPDRVIVEVDVEEQPTGSLGFGGSFSSDAGVGVFLNFSESNFLGRGQRLSFDIATTSETGDTEVSFTEPALLGRDLRFNVTGFQRRSDSNNSDFDTEETGLSTSLNFPLGEFSRLQVGYALSIDEVTNVDAGSSPIIMAEIGEDTVSAISYNYIYDTRSTGIDPNAGVLLTFSQEFAGVGGDVEYIRTTARATAQRRLRNEEFTLRATIEGGNLTTLGNTSSRVTDRFFLSSAQLRGFDFRGLGPRDLNAPNMDALGGLNYVAARFEYGFPIGFVADLGISGGVFLDVGTVWSLDNTNGAGGPNSVDDDFNLRSSVGLSIFWDTAIGPLTFNFTEAIRSESFDETRSFDIALTARF
jgi:outer membrane protein insertion porin family